MKNLIDKIEVRLINLLLLTNREIEVLNLLKRGKKNKEIAEELHLSTEAIRSRLKKTYEKLDVRNRTEAVSKLWEIEDEKQSNH